MRANRVDCDDYRICLRRVIEDGVFVVMMDEIFADHFVAVNYPESSNILCTMDGYIRFSAVTMYLQKWSPFLGPFIWVVYPAVEAGLIEEIVADKKYLWRLQGLSGGRDSGLLDN